MKNKFFMAATLLVMNTAMAAQAININPETATARYMDSIKNDPQQLLVFLQNMPKGGDLHNHTSGATMAENLIRYAQGGHYCINRKDFSVGKNAQCVAADLLDHASDDFNLYNGLIDAWSMRNFTPIKESKHDHFFAAFGKFISLTDQYSGDILAELTERAGQQNELYLELLVTPEVMSAGAIGKKAGWDSDLGALRQKLLASGINDVVKKVSQDLTEDEQIQQTKLNCSSQTPVAGCAVKVRYQFLALREQPPEQVFAQLLTGFEAATQDKRIVGVNLVQPEDGYISMRDYKLHMQMMNFLHKLYPNVHISLHAGELNSSVVPPEGLRFHIREAIEVGNAERIGHGVDIAYETNASQLLKEMSEKHIMVEINLSSNATILGVEGNNHPLPLYMQNNVPVALSTDDEGILRTNLTEQYQKAILTYHLTYQAIKMLVRNSIGYSFLPGKSLWQDYNFRLVDAACMRDVLGAEHVSNACEEFLNANEKAQTQWELEKRFLKFEHDHIGA